jgi:phage-related protein
LEHAVVKAAEQPSGLLARKPERAAQDSPVYDQTPAPAETRDRPARSQPPCNGCSDTRPPLLHPVLSLQRSIGNRAVGWLLDSQPSTTESREPEKEADEQPIQRKCQSCIDDEEPIQLKAQSADNGVLHPMLAEALLLSAHRRPPVLQAKFEPEAPTTNGTSNREIIPKNSPGEPLDDRTRGFMESGLGTRLSQVRIHRDAQSAEAAEALNATAFSTGQDVYFAAGKYAPGHSEGQRLLAHELAHTVQQSNGLKPTKLARKAADVAVSDPDDPLEREADAAADRVMAHDPLPAPPPVPPAAGANGISKPDSNGASNPQPPPLPVTEAPVIQREENADVPWWQKTAADVVAHISPGLAEIIRVGPFQYFKRKLEGLVKNGLPAFLGRFSIGGAIDGIKAWFARTFNSIKEAFKGDSKACKAFADMINKLREVAEKFINSQEIQQLKQGFQGLDDAFTEFTKIVLAPQFDALKEFLGAAWDGIKSLADTISGWASQVREAFSWAWDWAAEQLGLSGSNETGVWAWVKRQASAVWNDIKQGFAPVAEPLKKIGKVVAGLTPLGQIYVIVEEGPKVVSAVTWLWEHRDDPDIAKHAREMKNTYLPQLIDAVQSFDANISSGFNWLSDTVGSLSDTILDLLGGIFKIPLLDIAHATFQTIRDKISEFVNWSRETFRQGIGWVKELGQKISDFVAPYKEVLSSVVTAILDPPMIPVIIAGWAWRSLHRCLKQPLIEFLLDIVIKALEAIPNLLIFGPLWPLLKAGVLGFLKQVAKQAYEVQEQVSDKFAKIISGASPDFLFGFVKGFLGGIWDGIADPFRAIWGVLEGVHWVIDFFGNLAAEALGAPRPAPTTAPAAPPAKGEAGAPSPGAASTATAPATGVAPRAAPAASSGAAPAAPAMAAGVSVPVPAAPAAAVTAAVATPAVAAGAPLPMAAPSPPAAAPGPSGGPTAAPTAEGQPQPMGGAPAAELSRRATPALSPADRNDLASQAKDFVGEIAPDVNTVTTNFWDAAAEYFKGGGGMTFDSLVKKLGEAWQRMLQLMQQKGGELAESFIKWFMSDTAEDEIGDKVGWLSGTIVFQLLLEFITAGGWTAAGPVVMAIAKFINWPMEVFGQALKIIGRLGRYLIDGAKGLASVIKDAAAGVLKVVGEAIGRLGEKITAFVERLVGRFGKFFEKEAGTALEREGAGLLEKEGAKLTKEEAEKLTEEQLAKGARKEAEKKAELALEGATTAQKGAAEEAERRAAKEAEEKTAKEAEQKTAREGEERSAREAAEHPLAVAEAQTIEAAMQVANAPVPVLIGALDALKTTFTWIQRFEADSNGIGYFVWMIGSPRTPIGFYDPRAVRASLEEQYPGAVTSTTVPPASAPNVRLAGQRHPVTGIPFDTRGFPIFDHVAAFDTRIPSATSSVADRGLHFRTATSELRDAIRSGRISAGRFSADQLRAIEEGAEKVPGFTWHHHQDFGRMQLVPTDIHAPTTHIGGFRMSAGA